VGAGQKGPVTRQRISSVAVLCRIAHAAPFCAEFVKGRAAMAARIWRRSSIAWSRVYAQLALFPLWPEAIAADLGTREREVLARHEAQRTVPHRSFALKVSMASGVILHARGFGRQALVVSAAGASGFGNPSRAFGLRGGRCRRGGRLHRRQRRLGWRGLRRAVSCNGQREPEQH
jgi:hypothetical protein